MIHAIFIVLALITLMFAVVIGLASVRGGVDLEGLFFAVMLMGIGLSLFFKKTIEHWYRQWLTSSHHRRIGNDTPIALDDSSQPQPRVLLTKQTSGRMFLLGFYFSLFTCVAGIFLCVFGPWPCTTLLLSFISIPLWEPAMGVILLGLIFKRFLFGIKINSYSSAYIHDSAFQQWPEVLAYYPRTFQESIRVFFVLVDTFILNLAFGYLAPITMIQGIFMMGYAFYALRKI